jgi:NAD-dependent dihydropyrimidine dehydrogenase PreA subunit
MKPGDRLDIPVVPQTLRSHPATERLGGGNTMAHVITDNCIKDGLCLDACPNDSIHPRTDEDGYDTATQLFIDPNECIDCGACVPACTSDALFALDDVPADKQHFIAINEAHFA